MLICEGTRERMNPASREVLVVEVLGFVSVFNVAIIIGKESRILKSPTLFPGLSSVLL